MIPRCCCCFLEQEILLIPSCIQWESGVNLGSKCSTIFVSLTVGVRCGSKSSAAYFCETWTVLLQGINPVQGDLAAQTQVYRHLVLVCWAMPEALFSVGMHVCGWLVQPGMSKCKSCAPVCKNVLRLLDTIGKDPITHVQQIQPTKFEIQI